MGVTYWLKFKLLITKSYLPFAEKGFTLIESLLNLMIFSLIMHALLVSTQSFSRLDQAIKNDRTLDWQNFMLLFQTELDQYDITQVDSREINLKERSGEQFSFQVILQNNKIYRRPGHHPYLYGVKDWQVSLNGSFLNILVEMVEGQIFYGSFKVTLKD